MSIYILIIVLMMICSYYIKRSRIEDKKKAFLWVGTVLIVLLCGLRNFKIGADTIQYVAYYEQVAVTPWRMLEHIMNYGGFERGFQIYTKLLTYISKEPTFYLLISAFLINILVAIVIYRNSRDVFLSLFLYFTIGNFIFQLSGMRQGIAMAITFLSIETIKKRKGFLFLLLIFIASCFHQTALAFLPIYFIAYRKIDWKNFLTMIIGCIVIFIGNEFLARMGNNIFGTDYDRGSPEGGVIVIFILVATITGSYIFRKKLLTNDSDNLIYFNATVIALLTYILRYWVQIAERVSMYFQFTLILIIPNIIQAIDSEELRKLVYAMTVLFSALLFLYRLGYSVTISPYSFFWQ